VCASCGAADSCSQVTFTQRIEDYTEAFGEWMYAHCDMPFSLEDRIYCMDDFIGRFIDPVTASLASAIKKDMPRVDGYELVCKKPFIPAAAGNGFVVSDDDLGLALSMAHDLLGDCFIIGVVYRWQKVKSKSHKVRTGMLATCA
jgi:hypothetical protein